MPEMKGTPLTLHVHALFLPERRAKFLDFGRETALDILCCQGFVS